ncbi:sulfite exporter TauE/SafE family protein [Fluviicola sp.]|jgi:sulfite exporter TauE/SafE|uniref:sulfite exporter TauE/SafE family protein n=1 Tax=Fluviicola sp. TaxID=1917219 RepID=UPI00282258EA|nr:sulfite exporter TauE/SafE family protein [Fluviicola sp.]MDR0800971.1 sulfite exporter TauE/SafE family protein [Fluviicola sp.]
MTFYLSLFLLGLAGSFHCMTMCGPISMALPLNRQSSSTLIRGILLNNFGRIVTYSSLGLIFGTIGFSLGVFRFFQIGSIVFGLTLIVLAWHRQWINKLELRNRIFNQWTSRKIGSLLRKKGHFNLFFIGLLNGLLPCGMIFLALASSLLSSNPWETALGMSFFGLGTLPGMVSVAYFAQKMGQSFRGKLTHIYPYLLTLIGILVVLRGTNLGIPYLSPKIETTQRTKHQTDSEMLQKQVMCHTIDREKEETSD